MSRDLIRRIAWVCHKIRTVNLFTAYNKHCFNSQFPPYIHLKNDVVNGFLLLHSSFFFVNRILWLLSHVMFLVLVTYLNFESTENNVDNSDDWVLQKDRQLNDESYVSRFTPIFLTQPLNVRKADYIQPISGWVREPVLVPLGFILVFHFSSTFPSTDIYSSQRVMIQFT